MELSAEAIEISRALAFSLDPPQNVILHTPELERIAALPRRKWLEADPAVQELVARMTAWLRTPNGTQTLRAVQAVSLAEMYYHGGLFGPQRVGSGKCVDGATEVFDTTAGRRRRVDELGSFCTAAMTRDGKIESAVATAERSGEKMCRRLLLADGSTVVLSDDHPVFTGRGWVRAADVQETDLVATARGVPEPDQYTDVSRDEVLFAAYLLSDGCVSQKMTGFTNATPVVLTEFCQVSERLADYTRNLQKGHTAEGVVIRKSRTKATELAVRGVSWFRRKWGIKGLAKTKRLPAAFWGMSRENIGLFLNRFWACDGWVDKTGPGIVLASEGMIDDLKFLLLRVGVHARKAFKPSKCNGRLFDAWRLTIPRHDIETFFKTVGLVLGKESVCSAFLSAHRALTRNTNVDVVPISRPQVYRMSDELGYRGVGRDWLSRVGYPRRALIEALGATDGQFVGREKFGHVCDAVGYAGQLRWLADSDLCWERVRGNAPIGTRPVFDLSVPGYGCFVGNNIVLHNTLTTFLAAVVLGAKRPVLIIPAKLRAKTIREFEKLYADWRGPASLRIISYEELSNDSAPEGMRILDLADPDVLIFDECHRIKDESRARTRNVRRFIRAHPAVKVVALSGTITKRSIRDYAHVLFWALKQYAPLPRGHESLEEWAHALDVKVNEKDRVQVGALVELALPEDWRNPDGSAADDITIARRGFRRRLIETPGVVAYSRDYDGASIYIEAVEPVYNEATEAAFKNLRQHWILPSGESVLPEKTTAGPDPAAVKRGDMTGMAKWSHARQLSLGFCYYIDPAPPLWWKNPRAEWHRGVREVLSNTGGKAIDSPKQVAEACRSAWWVNAAPQTRERWEDLRRRYEEWKAVEDKFTPEKKAMWLDDGPLDLVVKWMEHHRGIVWCEHIEFAERLARHTGAPYFGAGGVDATGAQIESARPTKCRKGIIASIKSNIEGRNLQHHWWENFITSCPTGGDEIEQLFGRTHREEQPEDEVNFWIVIGSREQGEAWLQSRDDACYQAESTREHDGAEVQPKILTADQMMPDFFELQRRATSARYW